MHILKNQLVNAKSLRNALKNDILGGRKSSTTTNSPKIPDCPYTPSRYNGAPYDQLKAAYASSISPTLKPFYKQPVLLHEGRGQWLWDHNGKRYLDMFGGIATVSVGHCHPKVVAAVQEQTSKLNHISPRYMHPRLYEYVEKLTRKLPKDLNVIYLTNSGSESSELAFLMARIHTGKQHIISIRNCYHGGTFASMAATALSSWKYPIGLPAGFIHVQHPDVYRGSWGCSRCRDCVVTVGTGKCTCEEGGECFAANKYLESLEDVFKFDLPQNAGCAAFIAESIQGVGGVIQYPKSYLKKATDLVREKGGLYIADEVQTGFGRTGEHFWGFQAHGVIPDIVTMAKGIGNGFPFGAVATTSEIADSLNRSLFLSTFAGNPLACAAGSAVLDIIEEERLQENSRVVGTHLLHRLSTLLIDFPNVVGDVRGKGLMVGVEFVEDAETKKHMRKEHVLEIFEDLKDMGLLVGTGGFNGNVLRIKPPMCVTNEDADFTVEVIKNALHSYQDRHLRNKESVFFNSV